MKSFEGNTLIVVLSAVAVFCFTMLGLTALNTALLPAPVVSQKSRLVCFDMAHNLRINLIEYNIRFDGNIIRFTNGEGEYAIYPTTGWLCSIVSAE